MPEVTNLLLNLTTSLEVKRNEYPEQPSFETETKFFALLAHISNLLRQEFY